MAEGTIQTWTRNIPDGPNLRMAVVHITPGNYACMWYESVTRWSNMEHHAKETGTDLNDLRCRLRAEGFKVHTSSIFQI